MSPIPGEPLDRDPQELTTADGRKVKVTLPGFKPPPKPSKTQEHGSPEPPRDDPRPPVNPNHTGI